MVLLVEMVLVLWLQIIQAYVMVWVLHKMVQDVQADWILGVVHLVLVELMDILVQQYKPVVVAVATTVVELV